MHAVSNLDAMSTGTRQGPSTPWPGVRVSRLLRALAVLVVMLGSASAAAAQTAITLAWDANTEPDIAGYEVSYGTQSGVYSTIIDVGNVTSQPFTLTSGVVYYFAVKAYNSASPRQYSPYSVEVSTGAAIINRAPTLTQPANQTSAENTNISLQLVASDPDLNPLTFSATGLPASLMLNATTGVISGTLTSTSAGTYAVMATVSDGALTNSQTFAWTVTDVVVKTTPVITWANPASIVYGTPLSGTQLNATANVAGTFVYSPAAGTILNAGTKTLSVTFTPSDTAKYTATTRTVTISVAKATTTVAWSSPKRITKGKPLSSTELNATAAVTGTVSDVTQADAKPPVAGTFVYTPPAGTVLAVGTYTLSVTFTPTDSVNYSTATATMSLDVLAQDGANQAPIGAFDTPADGATGLQGSFAVTGWALDDVGVDRVELWRDLVAGEDPADAYTTDPTHPAYGKVFITNTLFVTNSRPDVEGLYSTYPFANRAGWGYLLLSWGLPNQGNGVYTLYAIAFDGDGQHTLLGTKTLAMDNAHATKPFGALDTPGYGATVSGAFWNYGWALTPGTECAVTNGHVSMAIDSGPYVTAQYGAARSDIAAAFPGSTNAGNAGGAYYIDTSKLSNGLHQIGWVVTDSCGRQDGIGSRFFTVMNGAGAARGALGDGGGALGDGAGAVGDGGGAVGDGAGAQLPTVADNTLATSAVTVSAVTPNGAGTLSAVTPNGAGTLSAATPSGAARSAGSDQTVGAQLIAPDQDAVLAARPSPEPLAATTGSVAVRQLGSDWQDVQLDGEGRYAVDVAQGGRLEIRLPRAEGTYAGFHEVREHRRLLPSGSSFDRQAGVFYWQPDAAFLGTFDLVFDGAGGEAVHLRVVVK
ncbi:MAG: Ig domain-containing protein [Acidobacteria bacterium]|nr:Ig domain-containing protein [Acidobacteriota bacterium]